MTRHTGAHSLDPGHVFVVHGDLRLLACDDVLVPSDDRLHVTEGFSDLLDDVLVHDDDYAPRVPGDAVATAGSDGPLLVHADREPRCWLVDTATGDVDRLVARVDRFVRAVVDRAGDEPARHGRSKRLVGMPLVGTGSGGAGGWRGDVIVALLPHLVDLAARVDVDVALVLGDPRDHSATQAVRRRCIERWPLDEDLLRRADDLAALALQGRLALFVGAGVSRAAGMPVWSELLERLADAAGADDEDRRRLDRLQPPDAAEVLLRRLGPERLGRQIQELYDRSQHALSHALLAALPVEEIVTTNYDPLLESAYSGAGRPLEVLPHAWRERPATAAQAPPWLVKLHGDAGRPEDVVLTRESYLRLQEERAALAGVVPTLLLTRHVLFVGLSLLDDTFVRAAHQTRRVLRADSADGRHGDDAASPAGTALSLRDDPLRRELWAPDLDYVPLDCAEAPMARAARRLEIFLDRLAAGTSPPVGWLLDDRYSGLRTAADSALAGVLASLADLPADATSSLGWEPVMRTLTDLGLPHPPT